MVSFSSGVNHACIALDSGKVFCLGRNYAGQLGFGTSPLKYFLEEEEELRPFRKYFLFSSSLPIPHFTEEVSLGDKIITFHKVVVSDNTSCAISNERPSGLYCWGKLDSLSSVEGEERKSNLERAFTIQPKKIQLPLDGAGIVDVALNGHKVCITNEKGKGYCKLKLIDSASWTEYQMTEVKFPLKQTRLSESNHWFVVDADDRVFGSLELKMKPIKLQYKSFQ
jgi:alpha-tubulin suppressor-like RCC1 family protein